jgi:Rho termination factor-like protein
MPTLTELRQQCKARGLKGYSRMRKPDMERRITADDHRKADNACGRQWECACAACHMARYRTINRGKRRRDSDLRAILAEMLADYEHLITGGAPENEAERAVLIERAKKALGYPSRKAKPMAGGMSAEPMPSAPRITHETWPAQRLLLAEIAAESESGVKHGSVKWLRERAREVGLRGRSKMRKSELVAALEKAWVAA